MRRWLPALALAVLLGGCASAGSPSPGPTPSGAPEPSASATPVPRFVGAADDGAVFAMTVGQTTTLRTEQGTADPVVEGDAVLLVESVNVTDSGAREGVVRAVEAGRATVSGDDWTLAFEIAR
jgi:uncharacterized lipoprotein YmbA